MRYILETNFKWELFGVLVCLALGMGLLADYFNVSNVWESVMLSILVVVIGINTIWTTWKLYDGIKYDLWEGFRYNDKTGYRLSLVMEIGFVTLMFLRGDLIGCLLGGLSLYSFAGEMYIIKKCEEEE